MCAVLALAAKFLSDHYGAPAMLMALLLGLAFHFLVEDDNAKCGPGVDTASKSILKIGVALLGARVSFDLLTHLGAATIALITASIVMTIGFAFIGARLLGRGWRLAVLTGGAVSICGASAALAIAAVLPKNEHSERNLTFTVFGVTILSTLAMVVYPIIAKWLVLSDTEAGVFLGGTIHDVAQVVGAGFTLSDGVGEAATTVKLIRVTLLAPLILLLAFILGRFNLTGGHSGKRQPIIPTFVVGFLVLATFNSFGLFAPWLQAQLWALSKWAMLAAIAGVGIKTELRRILHIPFQSIILILAETVFIAVFVLAGTIWFLR